jgi:7-cyano-7-deazaguanine synthase
MQHGALVLFSGGQDSTTCLAWALARGDHVETIAFDYRQRHRRELDARLRVIDGIKTLFPSWAGRLGADHLLDLGLLGEISETALTREMEFEITASKLPNTFVPGRNLVFLAIAAAVAYRRGIGTLVGGMSETDFSGYPDCRDDTIKAMQVALSLGMDRPLRIETPLMWIDKAQTWQLAKDLGGDALVRLVIEETHTCYLSEKGERHGWGHGCGQCPACALRKRGFEAWTGKS